MCGRTIILVALMTAVTHAQDVPVIAPADAKDHIGRKVIVEMVAKSARHVSGQVSLYANRPHRRVRSIEKLTILPAECTYSK